MSIRSNTKFKKESIKKLNLTSRIVEVMTEAGWEDITSLPSVDGHVLHSKGEDGLQEITFQISDSYSRAAAYNVSTTSYRYGSIRLLKSYTPGPAGKAGLADPPSHYWQYVSYMYRAGLENMDLNLYYNANKDRGIFIIEDPFATDCMWFYVGKPRPNYSKAYKDQNTVLVAQNNRYVGNVIVQGLADTTYKEPVAGVIMVNNTGNAKNVVGELMLSEIAFGTNESGFIGYVDGIYAIMKNLNESNTGGNRSVVVGDRRLKIIKCAPPLTGSSWVNLNDSIPHIAIELEEGFE